MSKYEDPTQLDYRYGGDTVDDFAQKYMKTVAYIFSALNELRSPTGGTLTQNPEAYQLKVDDNKLYIRNQANTDWILLGDVQENFGFRTSASDAFMHESDVADSGTAGKLIRADASGKLNADILGNAAKIADKAIQMGLDLADEDRLVYDKDTDTITNRPLQFKVDGDKIYARKDATTGWVLLGDLKQNLGFRSSTDDAFLTESDVADNGTAGKLIRADVNGKLNADILGNARKMAGKTFAPEDLQDGQIPVYRKSDGTWHAENKGTVGTGKNLMIMDGDKMLGEYNGDEMKAIDIQKSSLTKALAESTGYGIVSGCEPSISGLTVTVGAGVIHLADGTRKEIVQTNITLDAADPTNPRIDLVYINVDGEVAKITGTAAASPSAPTLPTGAIKVADVVVEQGASTGTVVDNRDYGPKLNKPEGFFLGAFFTRTTSSASGADRVTNFFASKNGVDWKHINKNVSLGNGGDYPYWGGDPSLIYYKGKFYVAVSQQDRTADFLIYTSTDFVNWQGKKINLGLTNANRAVWAPDFFIGKDGSLYVSLSYSENWPTFDIVITRCTDIDSLTFSTPVPITLWDGIDTTNLSTDRSHIDSSIVLKDNEYYMAVKNEVKNRIEVFKSTDLYSGWKKITSSVFNENTEGPTIKYINGIWHIWFDVFATKNTGLQSAYIHALSNDLINFFDYEELSHDDETYEHNIRHGSIIYINNNSNAGYVVKQLDDFTTTETTQLYCGMNSTTPLRTDVGALIDLQGTYKENNYYVIDDLVLYPYCDFRVMRPLLIKNISNPLNVNNVKFFLYDSASYLKINTIEGANCNYVATPSRFESFALKLEKQRGNTSLTRIDDNPVYFMTVGNSATTGYVHLFDMTAENWCSSDTIFYLESTSGYSHNAIYHVRCQKFNNSYTVYGNLLKSITDSHIKLYAVNYNDKISIYAEHPIVTMVHRMSIITKGQYIRWTEINIAMPNTIVESLSELGGTVTEIVS